MQVAGAQTPPAPEVPHLQLKVTEELPVSGLVRSLWGINPRCDNEGNIYYRPPGVPPAPPWIGSIVRISADGEKVTAVDLDSLPDFGENRLIKTWTTGLRGEIHVLARNKAREQYLLHFDDDGEFKSADKLDSHFMFYHLAVFPTGELLAAGLKEHEGMNEVLGEPYTAIFDRNGKLMKELSFLDDVKRQSDNPDQSSEAVGMGDAVPADDGNIYLMRWTEKHLLLVVSPAGEQVRKLNLVPPHEGWDSFHFRVAGGKIVMEYFKPGYRERDSSTIVYSLYDAESGEHQADYEITPETNGMFACYTPNQFTFLTIQGEGLSIVHAVPK